MREIRTLGSAWGDEFKKKPRSLGEGTGMKMPDNGEAPQRANASRLVSTILLDLWFERVVKRRLRGEAYLVRYIDDFVICFQYRSDALRVQDALRNRLGRFGLTLEPTKTKLVEFVPVGPARARPRRLDIRKTGEFSNAITGEN